MIIKGYQNTPRLKVPLVIRNGNAKMWKHTFKKNDFQLRILLMLKPSKSLVPGKELLVVFDKGLNNTLKIWSVYSFV
jgi:hypothetical protein